MPADDHLLMEIHKISVLQRLAVAASCLIFYLLAIKLPIYRVVDIALLATLALLACVEKLCSTMNLISVERDWVCTASLPRLIPYFKVKANFNLIGCGGRWR
jgi:hypothetical protein